MIDTEEHTLFGLQMRSSHLVLGTDTEALVTNTILQLSLPIVDHLRVARSAPRAKPSHRTSRKQSKGVRFARIDTENPITDVL